MLDVLSYNGTLGVAWKVDSKDGLLKLYTPWQMDSGKWTVSASHLTPDCEIEFDYKGGRYPTREAALNAVWKAAEDHKKKLNEFVGENRVLEEGKKIPDSGIDRFEKFSDEEIDEVVKSTMVGGATLTGLLGTSAWMAPGAAAASVAEAIVKDQKKLIPCSAYCEGEYGIKDLYIGVPCVIGKNGIEKVLELKISSDEMAQLRESEAAVRKTTSVLKELNVL